MESVGRLILAKIRTLGDLELATLSCLIAEQHCIIRCSSDLIENLEHELRLIGRDVFGLPVAVLNFSADTSLDDFGSAILIETEAVYVDDTDQKTRFSSISSIDASSRREAYKNAEPSSIDSHQIANIVIARNLHLATSQLQIQVLELIRAKRIFTRTAVHVAPKRFLFVALAPIGPDSQLNTHLNDHFFISHIHSAEDELLNLEESATRNSALHNPNCSASDTRFVLNDKRSSSSLDSGSQIFSRSDIDHLVKLSNSVRMTAEIRAYLHNIVIFMRMNRAVAAGVSSLATRHFHLLARALAPLHGLDYVPPSLVALAARKIYPHRITLTTPEKERSMQWGSSLQTVREELDGITVEDVIEDVLSSVQVPL